MADLNNKIAVVFDDHKLFADSFSSWLERTGVFYFVYSFTDKMDLIHFFVEKNFKNVYLFADYYIESGNSLAILNDIKKASPSVRIIFLTSVINPVLIKKALELKPKGFLSKTPGMDEVFECLKRIDYNETYISAYISSFLNGNYKEEDQVVFSSRELEVLAFFAKGCSVVKTAELLNLSRHTVIAHRRKMMARANCNSIIELLSYARSLDLIE